MAKAKTVKCHNCGAENPADYTFCHHCRVPPKSAAAAKTAKKSSAKKGAKKR